MNPVIKFYADRQRSVRKGVELLSCAKNLIKFDCLPQSFPSLLFTLPFFAKKEIKRAVNE